jgi:hypothetical protein
MDDVPAPPTVATTRTQWLLLVVILIAGATLRWIHIDADSFWLDEILTVELSSGHGFAHLDLPREVVIESPPDFIRLKHAQSWASTLTQSSTDVHPPLFYFVLRVWRMIFSDSDAKIRALSVVLSLFAIVMLFLAVQAMSGPRPALWAAALMAVAGPQIEYAQENRSYMLLLAALLAAAAALLRIERLGLTTARAVALGTSCLAAALTHYLAMPLLAVVGLYALIRLHGKNRRGTLLALLATAAIFAAVWGPFALRQQPDFFNRIQHTGGHARTTARVLYNGCLLPMHYFTNAPTRSWISTLGASLFVLPMLLKQWRRDLLFWWMWLIGGVGFVIAGDLVRGGTMAESIRFTLAAGPAAYALVPLLTTRRRGLLVHALPLLLFVACIASLGAAYTRWKWDWRSLGQAMSRQLRSDDVLVIYNSPGAEHWNAPCDYVCINYYATPMPIPTALLSHPPSPEVLTRLRAARRVWLFTPSHDVAARVLFPGTRVSNQEMSPFVGTLVEVNLE